MAERTACTWCGKDGIAVRQDGTLWRHWDAQRDETCEQRDPDEEGWQKMTEAEAFLFEDPTPVAPARKTKDKRGYYVKDPRIGDFRRFKNGNPVPFTRATTFIKAASDRTALTEWNERNVLLGCARNPQVAAKALGIDPASKDGKQDLNGLVAELAELAGSKDAANKGTDLHKSLELYFGGTHYMKLPKEHHRFIVAVGEELDRCGLTVVPGTLERTVFYDLPNDKGVVGTFDCILRHDETGRYYMGDFKSGARMDYAWGEYQAQLAIYRDGYTVHGPYVWGDKPENDRWEEPFLTLDPQSAIILHVPVKHDTPEPYCDALRVDLAEGRAQIALCQTNREAAAKRPKPVAWAPDETPPPVTLPVSAEPEERDWEAEFGQATSKLHLAGLYESARSVIDDEVRLRSLIEIGMARLKSLENEPPF